MDTSDKPVPEPLPTNLNDLNKRTYQNMHIEGYGYETATHLPCPFCGSKDWLVMKVIDFDQEALQKGATCNECQRSAKGLEPVVREALVLSLYKQEALTFRIGIQKCAECN